MRNISLELGKHFIEECSYDLAVNALTKAIVIEPHNAQIYDFRGIAYGSNREYHKAIADFNMAIEIDNQLAAAYNNRALSHWALDMIEEALNDINKAIELDSDVAVFFVNSGLIQYAKGDFQEAVLDYSLAIIISGFTGIDAYNGRGEAYAEVGEYQKALADFDRSLALNPNDVVAFANYALVNNLLKKQAQSDN
ncbi:MAG: tetratricopeptide repeat protein [Thermodesulfobacteriota bacterium]|nr:tetratricopeptide repeat protein [Thermodesulfobacteriota bacterium]